MTYPTVGVVMPTRNNGDTIGAALASVLAQSPAPSSVVVVDAASTDGTAEIVAVTPGVELIMQDGVGLGAARNQGIAALDTELIAFCDGDDRWSATSLAVRVAHLRANPGCVAVTGHYLPFVPEDVTTDVVREPVDGLEGRLAPANREARPALTPGGVVIRREALADLGPFATDLRIATDTEWLVRMRQLDLRLDVIDEVVLLKARRPTSLSTDVDTYRSELLRVARDFVKRR